MIPTISPRLRNTPIPARQVRLLLTIFFVRHILGIGAFLWMTWAAYSLHLPAWWVLAAFGGVYALGVLWNGRKLLLQYHRRRAAEQGPLPPGGAA